jgi:hypothetical protein
MKSRNIRGRALYRYLEPGGSVGHTLNKESLGGNLATRCYRNIPIRWIGEN